jgi:hypothetical protein
LPQKSASKKNLPLKFGRVQNLPLIVEKIFKTIEFSSFNEAPWQ